MQTNYSEQDTERARQAERSSAGLKTQNLPEMPAFGSGGLSAPAAMPAQQGNWYGWLLIGLGVLWLMGQAGMARLELEGGFVLLTIASCFLFFAFWKRIYGLFIPGAILAGLSVGVTFADMTNGVSILWGLALGFLGILFGGKALYGIRNNWPIYPAVPLFAVGCIVAVTSAPFIGGFAIVYPLLLIALGFYLGWGRRRI